MNYNKKQILMAIIAIVIAMLLFPPFEIINQRVVYNMGYGLIIDPPKSKSGIVATVNVSVLLIQWFVVFVVGGIVFFSFSNEETKEQ